MRKTLAIPAGLLAAAALMFAPALASADTGSSLTVVGTSDVSDSGLIPNFLQPQFQQQFPQFTFKYVGSATGAAIQSAMNGTGGPSALIVHAASLENQFVANGFSLNNQFGYAIWTNDFVFAGSTADPAGVAASAPNNVAQAFADVAKAGVAGTAVFYSRGGTNNASGTTVEEHTLWALLGSSGLAPAGLVLCNVSAADGGGATPIKSTVQATSGQPCPDSGSVSQADAPSWYFINGGNQAASVIAANNCNGFTSGANSCYVLTDRGTFDYLSSGTDPAGTIPNLKIVTRDNSASAPGGANELINYFHVYVINPSKPGETVNLTAAQDFVSFLTSQAFQAQLKSYLPTVDPGGPPFKADASPKLTVSGLTTNYHAKQPMTVKGTVLNAQPGFPAPSGATVNVQQIVGGQPLTVASAKTNPAGAYRLKFTPTSTGSYQVSTGQVSQIEIPTLNPAYGDILSPASTTATKVTVHSALENFSVSSQGAKALVIGKVSPGTGHVKGTIAVLARAVGKHGAFNKLASQRLSATQGNFAISVPRAAGAWNFKVKFTDPGQVIAASSNTVKVTIAPKPTTRVSLGSVKTKNATLTIKGTTAPAGEAGAKVELLALGTASGAPTRFKILKTTNLDAGKTKLTLHTKANKGTRWVLELEYLRPGQAPSFSALRTVNVP